MTDEPTDLYWEIVPRSSTESTSYWWSALRFMRAYDRYSALQQVVNEMLARANQNVPKMRIAKGSSRIDPSAFEFALQGVFSVEEKREASLLGSEALHHLRSALDHLIYHASWHDSGEPKERTQFPICDSSKRWKGALKGYLDGLSAEHISWVKEVQPMMGATWSRDLAALSNADKHRLAVELTLTSKLHTDTSTMPDDPTDSRYSLVNIKEVEIRCRLVYGDKLDDVSATYNPMFAGAATLINRFLAEEGVPLINVEEPSDTPHL